MLGISMLVLTMMAREMQEKRDRVINQAHVGERGAAQVD